MWVLPGWRITMRYFVTAKTGGGTRAMAVLRHRNIIRYNNSWLAAGAVNLQTEFCLGSSLFHFLQPNCTLYTSPTDDIYGSTDSVDLPVRHLNEQALTLLPLPITSALECTQSGLK